MKQLGNILLIVSCLAIGSVSCDFESEPVYRKQLTDFSTFDMKKDSIWLGHKDSLGIDVSNLLLNNKYDGAKKEWKNGFACSRVKDTLRVDSSNLLSARAGGGFLSTNYVVGKNTGECIVKIKEEGELRVERLFVCNTTFSYFLMRSGSEFFERFGGKDGKAKDWLKLKIEVYEAGSKSKLLGKKEVMLADFTKEEKSKDYIVKKWAEVDLHEYLHVGELKFKLESNRGVKYLNMFCLDYIVTKVQVE